MVLCVAAFLLTINAVLRFTIFLAVLIEHPEFIFQSVQSAMADGNYSVYSDDALMQQISDGVVDATNKYAGLASIIGMLCGLPWFFLIRGKSFLTKDVTRVNNRVKPGTIALMVVLIMGVQFLVILLQLGFELLFGQNGSSLTDTIDEATTSLATSFWGVLYVVLIGPICEELVFRGAVMRKLERYGANFAIVISSLIFGLYHVILFQSVFAFLVGLVLAYTAGRFSMKWSILLHMITNGLVMLPLVTGSEFLDVVLTLCYMVAFAASILIIITGRRHLAAQRVAGAPSEPMVYSRAFSSPWLITYIVLCVLGGIQLQLLGIF